MLPGVHRVRVKLAGGKLAEYWYAYRGGPRILQAVAATPTALAREVARQTPVATDAYRAAIEKPAADKFLAHLAERYLASGEYAKLAERTKKDRRQALDVVRKDIGHMEIQALNASGARRALLDWRNSYKGTPATADRQMSALAALVKWARDNGEITGNPLDDWPRIYEANRAEAIWTKRDLSKLLRGAPPEFRQAVLMAAFTGLRLGDLVRLSWGNVGKDGITMATAKSRGKRQVVIPITPKVAAILKQIGRKDVGAVLTHSKGKPWTGWGLQTAMQRAKAGAKIQGLRFHDLRGTAATHFVRSGLPLADVATIMGWTPERVEQIARRYVTADAVAAGMMERIRKAR
jgi:integrase